MEKSFPPLDDAISYLSKVDWHKQMQRIIMIVAFIAAIITVAYEKLMAWYNNGGKDQIVTVYNNFILGCHLVYNWVISEAIPNAKLMINRATDSLFYNLAEVI